VNTYTPSSNTAGAQLLEKDIEISDSVGNQEEKRTKNNVVEQRHRLEKNEL